MSLTRSRSAERRARCAVAGVLVAALVASGTTAAVAVPADRSVDVRIGTAGQKPWFSGNTTPAAARPFGAVQFGPDTTASSDGRVRSISPSGYDRSENWVRGFSATHLSGAGAHILGDAPILPVLGAGSQPDRQAVGMVRSTERAAPGRYAVTLANGVKVGLSADEHTGLARFRFPKGRSGRILLKSTGSLGSKALASVRYADRRTVMVAVTADGPYGFPRGYRVWLKMRFSARWAGSRGWRNADGSGTILRFRKADSANLRVRVAVSFTDAAGAAANLRPVRDDFRFARSVAAGTAAWDRELSRVRTTGGSWSQQRIFDTALYHAMLHPTLASDVDGRYLGFDGKRHRMPAGRRHYTAIGGWDEYRTHMPFLALVRPDVAGDVAQSLVLAGQQGGWVPRWPMLGRYTGIMNGDSGAPTIAAAVAFGARGVDLAEAYRLLARQARPSTVPPGQGWFVARPGLAGYLQNGWVPAGTRERYIPRSLMGSTTLEYALDDFALSRLSRRLGRGADEQEFWRRSGSWRTLYNPAAGMLTERDASGALMPCCEGFQEGNAPQYTWMVPQDMGGLLNTLGTEPVVLARWQQFHTRLNAGVSPHAWLGNQPSFATPWAAHYLGRPDLSSHVVDRAMREVWSTAPDGLAGNEDLGSLSTWYLWAALGLYPLTPGTSVLGVTSPIFDEVTVTGLGRAPITVRGVGSGRVPTGLALDSRGTDNSWLDVGAGWPRTITVFRGTARSATWGVAPAHRPPSWPAPTN